MAGRVPRQEAGRPPQVSEIVLLEQRSDQRVSDGDDAIAVDEQPDHLAFERVIDDAQAHRRRQLADADGAADGAADGLGATDPLGAADALGPADPEAEGAGDGDVGADGLGDGSHNFSGFVRSP